MPETEPLWKKAAVGVGIVLLSLFLGWTMLRGCQGELRSWKHLFGIQDSQESDAAVALEGLPATLNNDIPVQWHQHWLKDRQGRFRFVGTGKSGSATLYYGARVTVKSGRYDRNDWSFISKADSDRFVSTPRTDEPADFAD